jgi:hypothetical protein
MKTPSIKIYSRIGFKSTAIDLKLEEVSSIRVQNIIEGRGLTYVPQSEVNSQLAVDCIMICCTERLAEIISEVDVMARVSLRRLDGQWCLVIQSIKNLKSIICKYVDFEKMESQDLTWDEIKNMI